MADADGHKPLMVLPYDFESGQGQYRIPKETHRLFTAPEEVGKFLPYMLARDEASLHEGFAGSRDRVFVGPGDAKAGLAVYHGRDEFFAYDKKDIIQKRLLAQIMQETIELLS